MKYYIGIDLGGTNIVAGVVNEAYEILAKASVKTNLPRPEQEIAADMAKVAKEAAEKAGLTMEDIGLIELNEASVRPGSYRKNGRENAAVVLDRCAHYGVKVVVSSDAHVECDILRHRYALELLKTVHFPEELVVNRSVDALMAALAEKKA